MGKKYYIDENRPMCITSLSTVYLYGSLKRELLNQLLYQYIKVNDMIFISLLLIEINHFITVTVYSM